MGGDENERFLDCSNTGLRLQPLLLCSTFPVLEFPLMSGGRGCKPLGLRLAMLAPPSGGLEVAALKPPPNTEGLIFSAFKMEVFTSGDLEFAARDGEDATDWR